MPKGYFDWHTDVGALSQQTINSSEAIIRSRLRDYLSRTGQIADYSLFDVNLDRWFVSLSDSCRYISHVNNRSILGEGTMQIVKTTACGGSTVAEIRFPNVVGDRAAVAVIFAIDDDLDTFTIQLASPQADDDIDARVRFDFGNNKTELFTPSGVWVEIEDITFKQPVNPDAPRFCKLSVDLTNGKYIRLQYNNTIVDVSNIQTNDTPDASINNVSCVLRVEDNSSNNASVFIDSVTLTINEP